MANLLTALFGSAPPQPALRFASEPDKDLEAVIDRVGRDRVFDRARSHGWGAYDGPPKWVWWEIIHELETEDRAKSEKD